MRAYALLLACGALAARLLLAYGALGSTPKPAPDGRCQTGESYRHKPSNHSSDFLVIITQTDVETKTVYFYPGDPKHKNARKLRTTESMGPAIVAFGVPLRKLKLQFKESRRLVLPVHTLQTPNHGIVYYICFGEVEMEARDIDMAAMAAAKQAKKAKKAQKTNG